MMTKWHVGFWDCKRALGENQGNLSEVWTSLNDNVSLWFISHY